MLKESRINSQIAGEGYRVTCYDDVLSTNELVKAAIKEGEKEGLVITALTQGAGYGRTGHTWKSPLGGLYFSMLLRPEVPMGQLPTLSLLTSYAIREALGDLDASLAEAVKIKWPNDVMCQGRKLCGVSLEQSEGAVCVGVATLMSAVFFLFREQFVAAFSSDAEIISLGKTMMLGTLLAVPVEGVYHMCSTFLQATGKVSFATLTSLMQKGLVFLPVLLLMEKLFGLDGIIFSNAVTTLISTGIALLLCRSWSRQMFSGAKG